MWTVPFLKMHDMTFSYCVQQGNSCHPGEKFVKSPGSTIIFSKALSLVASCCSVSVKICGVSVSRGKGKGKSSFFSFTFFRGKVLLFARLLSFRFSSAGGGGGHFGKWGCLVDTHGQKGEALDCVVFLCFLNYRGNRLISTFLRGKSTCKTHQRRVRPSHDGDAQVLAGAGDLNVGHLALKNGQAGDAWK